MDLRWIPFATTKYLSEVKDVEICCSAYFLMEIWKGEREVLLFIQNREVVWHFAICIAVLQIMQKFVVAKCRGEHIILYTPLRAINASFSQSKFKYTILCALYYKVSSL